MSQTFVCPRCGYACDRQIMLYRHLGRKLPCLPILSDTPTTVILTAMLKQNLTYGCDKCNKTFSKRGFFLKHIRRCGVEDHAAHVLACEFADNTGADEVASASASDGESCNN
jgi:hypothetical protein